MRLYELQNFKGGWFIGDFDPSIFRSKDFEVAIKSYSAGTVEPLHVHKVATEFTVIVTGQAQINGETFGPGSIVVLEPNEPAEFKAMTEVTTTVIKFPSAPNDKYILEK